MARREDAVRAFAEVFRGKQDAEVLRFALTGDGSDAFNADVSGRPGWAWVRYDEEPHKVSQVRNRIFPGIAQEVPVVIGKKFVTDRQVQILGINEPLYDMAMNEDQRVSYLVAPHGPTHHAIRGTDPAEIDLSNILNGKVRGTDPVSMSIYVESFMYYRAGEIVQFGGGGIDLTASIPGAVNQQRYMLISLDVPSMALRATPGLESPTTVPSTPPGVPLWNIPLSLVRLYNGQEEITNGDFWDYRIAFSPVGVHNMYRNFNQFMHYNELMWTRHLTGEL